MKLGFIGLGIMGGHMAANLQRAGHTLTVHNRSRAKAEPLLAAGASWAETPVAAAQGAEVLITMLSEPAAVRALGEGPQGFLSGLARGSLWMDCSTVNPSFSREMGATCAAVGVRFLDAPVSGSRAPAEKGELAFLVGGDAADVEAVQPLLDVMGNKVSHMGPAGAGTAMKMVTNLLLGLGAAAFAEALVLGESLGIAKETLLDSLLGGRMTPAFLAGKKAKLASGRYDVDFPLQWLHKDLQLASATAYETGAVLPTAHAAKEVFGLARAAGLGEQDYIAVYEALAHRGRS